MDRRGFLSTLAFGSQIAQRTEAPARADVLRFVNRKTGGHPYRYREGGKRPNIFLITLDMVSPDHYHPSRTMQNALETPTLRALFRDSVTFSNAFCASPLCAPARAALATGRYTYITANGERAHDGHETILRPTDVIFQEYLKASGYVTKHAGKGHLGTQKFMDAFDENDNAWDRWAPPIFDDETYLVHLARLGVKRQRYRKEISGLQQDRATRGVSFGGWIEQEDGRPFPIEAQYTHYLVGRAIEKLDAALAESKGERPVYLELDIFDPHQPFSIPDGFADREKALRAAFRLPESYERVRARNWKPAPDDPKIYSFYSKNWGLYNPETVLDYRVANALQMEVIDRALARFIAALKQRGLYEDSIIVFTSDHGEMNGRRALVDKGVYLFPDVLRVPLAVKAPGVAPRAVEETVSHLDIAPTLLGAARLEPMERLDGRPLPLDGKPLGDRDLLFECGWHVGVNFACAIQRQSAEGHHLYTYNCSSEVDELYDLASTDAVNLAQDPAHKKLRGEMVRRMGATLERDPRWIGYWHSFRLDHYEDLPRRGSGDAQMFRPI